MPCILLCSTAFKQGIDHECPGSNPPMFTLYIYARIGYLAACISNSLLTPAFSSCAPQLSSKALIMHMPFVTLFILLLLVNEPGSGGGHTQIGLVH